MESYILHTGKNSIREGILTKYGNRPALYMLYGGIVQDYTQMQSEFEKNKNKEKLEMKYYQMQVQ